MSSPAAADTAAAEFFIDWRSRVGSHRDRFYIPTVDFRRDAIPGGLCRKLLTATRGETESECFGPGVLVPAYNPDNVHRVQIDALGQLSDHRDNLPVEGRFYPRGLFLPAAGGAPLDRAPARVKRVDGDWLEIDLNHPLSQVEITLAARIDEERDRTRKAPGPSPAAGAGSDIAATVTANGPGMQVFEGDRSGGVFDDYPFTRDDASPDSLFYRLPRLVYHIDRTAVDEVTNIYRAHLRPGHRVLDLMSSWVSHLPPEVDELEVAGLGLNAEELSRNPRLREWRVHDLNLDSGLPFHDATFNVVVCTVSVEYLTQPLEVFREVTRVLRPGGVFVNTWSERWFPPKVISLWSRLHPFERQALVVELYRRAGGFDSVGTESVRGRPRPEDDPYASSMPTADPIYAVWATATD